MWNLIHSIFWPEQYVPHGHCYLWQAPLVTLHVVSNALIAIAYFSIPALLIFFVQKRRDVPFSRVFVLFGAFIVLCGIGHLLDIWTLWYPAYWLSETEHAITAFVSCITALQMVTLLPQFLALKTPAQLEVINQELQQEIIERQQIEADRNRAYAELEFRVQERTAELEKTLQELRRTQTQMIQSEKMSGLGQLVAGVAHEINNPVNFIFGNLKHAATYTQDLLGLLRLYQQHYPTPNLEIEQEIQGIDLEFLVADLPKLLTSMKVGADRIQKIVASLRNFSRMDEAEMKEVNIHDGIDSTLMILQHRLKVKPDTPGIEIIKDYSNLPLVECYAGQLNQVFMNLISNAIDALEEAFAVKRTTTPTIIIHTALVNNQEVSIQIADNGIGMPNHVKQRVFDPFYTTKPVGKGTGMGLSISYQVVTEKHKGTLQCVSEPNQGTKFMITIPIRQS